MPEDSDFFVRFWGVRGSIACPGAAWATYGGNTSCLEVRCGRQLLIFDGGTGLRQLGEHLKKEIPVDADLFFTHSHLDHIAGIPFFSALFEPSNRIRMWAGHLLAAQRTLRDVICSMMAEPLFPVPIDIFTAETSYHAVCRPIRFSTSRPPPSWLSGRCCRPRSSPACRCRNGRRDPSCRSPAPGHCGADC